MQTWLVTAQDSGTKLVTFLQRQSPDLSAKKIKGLIEKGLCEVNQRSERFASTLVGTGDCVTLKTSELNSSSVSLTEEITAHRILYQDEVLLAYDKPATVVSDDPKFLKALQCFCPSLILLHRLDKETTGILLFAKSVSIQQKMIGHFKQLQVKKNYVALVDGYVLQKEGIIDNYLGKICSFEGQAIRGSVPKAEGQRACTRWHVKQRAKEMTMLHCQPLTGRTHQLRVHCSEMGHPILGDALYGRHFTCPLKPKRCLLHAQQISFPHPITGKQIRISAALPQDMQKISQQLN